MEKVFTIVIADRNPHVRGFLQREMRGEGYRIRVTESAHDLLEWTFNHGSVDLIILDPDLPDVVDSQLLEALQGRMPPVPVVIHTHYANALAEAGKSFIFVEKGGGSSERLKQIAATLFDK